MKIIAIIAVILALATARHTFDDFLTTIAKPSTESVVDQLLNDMQLPEALKGSDTYIIISTAVGFSAGWMGLINTGFTGIDIIRGSPKDWFSYLFAALYLFAYNAQNGAYRQYMCTTFFNLIQN